MSGTAYLLISPDEALILDSCLKGEPEELESYLWLLARLGYCIVEQKSRAIKFDETTLWFLRSHLDMSISVGQTNAVDVLIKIYSALLRIVGNRYFPVVLELEVKEDADGSTSKNEASSKTIDSPGGRPPETAEPGQALSCPERGYYTQGEG